MNSGKLVLAGIASVMLAGASAIPSLAQQANGDKPTATTPRGPMAFVMQMFDTNSDGKITREEFDADKAKIFAEIDKNGDKKISYDEAKAWARDIMAKMPGPGAGPDGGPAAPADGKAPPADGKAPPAGDKADAGPGGMPGPMGGPGAMHGPMGDRDMGDRDRGDRDRGDGDWHHGPKGPHGGHHMGDMGPGRHMDPRQRLAEMFLRADANDDGFISQEEFDVMADRMFTRMDRNGDGVLDMKDMRRPHMMWDQRPGEGPKGGPSNG